MLALDARITTPWSGLMTQVDSHVETDAEITLEGALIARYTAGDDAAMDELIETWQTPAFWVARHVVRNDEVALDLVNDAFVKLLTSHTRYDRTRPFKPWFLRIVRNLAIDYLRRARAIPEQDLVEQAADNPDADHLEQNEMQAQIQTVLAALPEADRELLMMREVEGISAQDIAEIIGVAYATTRWRIHQARKRFKQLWTERYGEDPV